MEESVVFLKRCSHCEKEKSSDHFGVRKIASNGRIYHQSWCRECERRHKVEYRKTDQFRKSIAAYLARPEVQKRRKEIYTRSYWLHADERRTAQRGVKQRFFACRSRCRNRLKTSTDSGEIERLNALIETCNRELARLGVIPRCSARRVSVTLSDHDQSHDEFGKEG